MKTFKEDYFLGRKIIDLTGQKFGRLTVIKRVENKDGYSVWLCRCDCGNERKIKGDNLRSGSTKSCGCLKAEGKSHVIHGKSHTRLYKIYINMIQRCEKEYSTIYEYYGGRGIKVCDEWKEDFENFYNWSIAHGYNSKLTIDRIDPNGNYEPLNCRWVNMKEQNYNRRSSHIFKIDGVNYGIRELSQKIDLSEKIIQSRLDSGWTLEEIINTPKGQRRKK